MNAFFSTPAASLNESPGLVSSGPGEIAVDWGKLSQQPSIIF